MKHQKTKLLTILKILWEMPKKWPSTPFTHCFLNALYVGIALYSVEQANAQCYEDRHNTSLRDSWISCRISANPNPERPHGHWVLFELEERQAVSSLKLWNINHPEQLPNGTKTIAVDYINPDGSWAHHSSHEVAQAEASGFYEGEEIFLNGEFVTDKILINLMENYGGRCYGLAEVRIGLINKTTSLYEVSSDFFKVDIVPNPFVNKTRVTVKGLKGRQVICEVVNALGQVVFSDQPNTRAGIAQFEIQRNNLPPGIYHLKIIDGLRISSRKLSIQSL